jgi:hypothetical protein
MFFVLCSCASAKTSVELASESSSYYTEMWSISSTGNAVTSNEYVFNDVKKQAAMKSNSEGKDCFVALSDITSPRERITTKNMYGKSSDGSSFYYETPTEPYYSEPYASLIVSFHSYDECKNHEKNERLGKVFYNNETMKNAKGIEIKERIKEVLIWGLSIGLVVLLLPIL